MKSTLAVNKQMFNVKAQAAAGLTPENIPNNQLGIIDVATGLTISPTASFAQLPAVFSIIGKVNGKTYYIFDNVKKAQMFNQKKVVYQAQIAEVWETILTCCSCIEKVQISIGLSNFAHTQPYINPSDSNFVVSPEEMKCYCSCSGTHKVYENNILTMLLVNNANKDNSPYYTVSAKVDITDVDSGASLPSSDEALGDQYIKTGTNAGYYVYNGTAWVLVGDSTGNITDITTFVNIFKPLNTDDDQDNDGPLLTLVVTGKLQTGFNYSDIEANYIYPRGMRLSPSINAYGSCKNSFVKTQDLQYELGAGYDLRAEEWETMGYYTNMLYPLVDGKFQDKNLIYQFENNKNYHTVNFEFMTDTVNKNDGDKRLFGVLLGSETAGIINNLATTLGA